MTTTPTDASVAFAALTTVWTAVTEIWYALAHVGGLSDTVTATGVPSWLTVLTGGVLVGASFLFNSLLTDHEAIRAINAWRAHLPAPESVYRAGTVALSATGVAVLALVLAASVLGPAAQTRNFAILVVWVGWWAGYAMSTYVVGNTWPAANPWRTLAGLLPTSGAREFPEAYGAWPSVVGLLVLVWIEVVSPLAANAPALGGLVVAYTVFTLVGAHQYGPGVWFERVDPVSRVFRLYGRVAPVQRDADGIHLRLPGTALTEPDGHEEPGGTAFVVALLWVTTFDGLVATPAWNAVATPLLGVLGPETLLGRVGVSLVYLVAMLVGFAAFLGIYRLAAERSRTTVESFLAPAVIERWFAPALLPIAVGYHVAHFLGYFLTLSPALFAVLGHPLGGVGTAQVAVLPSWFGTLQLAFVVAGHLLAVWVAHALAMDLFPGVLRPIRSQYPFVVVMMVYTMTSAWVIGQPSVTPAFL